VIAGKDGPINEKAKSGLVGLQTLARLSNNNYGIDKYGRDCNVAKTCCYCKKLETQMDNALLMKCQRCKIAYYCSKECQVADWKRHKRPCKVMSNANESSVLKTARTTVLAFIDSNYFDIAKAVYKKRRSASPQDGFIVGD
jgi:SET domain-containing protein